MGIKALTSEQYLPSDKAVAAGSYIDGASAGTRRAFDVIDPAIAEPFARVGEVEQQHVRAALSAAEKASSSWRESTALERGKLLHRVADELIHRRGEIAKTITLENGKPLVILS